MRANEHPTPTVQCESCGRHTVGYLYRNGHIVCVECSRKTAGDAV